MYKWTTQFYQMPLGTYSKKRFKSPSPACNVYCRSEPVAMDTIYSDTPPIDSGVTTAEFFVGTESMICDVYPMKTDKQFNHCNTGQYLEKRSYV